MTLPADKQPITLQQAVRYFADEQVCIDTVAAIRWPNGPICPKCNNGEHYYLATQKRWKCKKCAKAIFNQIRHYFRGFGHPARQMAYRSLDAH